MRSRRVWLLAGLLAVLQGCAGSGPLAFRPPGPRERLDEQLTAWRELREQRVDCQASRFQDSPLVDCAEIQHAVEQLALEYPRNTDVLFAAAVLADDAGQRERAASWLDALFAVTPAHSDAGVLRARLAAHDGNLRLASRVLREQLTYAPGHSGLVEALASVQYLSGDLTAARESLASARALGAPGWRVDYNLGLVEEAANDRVAAMNAYRAVLAEKPDHDAAASRLRALEAAR